VRRPVRRWRGSAGARAAPQAVPQRLGGGDDQGLELAAGVGPGGHDTGAGDMQHPKRFSAPALAWGGEIDPDDGVNLAL
jgi:hypothetical protein